MSQLKEIKFDPSLLFIGSSTRRRKSSSSSAAGPNQEGGGQQQRTRKRQPSDQQINRNLLKEIRERQKLRNLEMLRRTDPSQSGAPLEPEKKGGALQDSLNYLKQMGSSKSSTPKSVSFNPQIITKPTLAIGQTHVIPGGMNAVQPMPYVSVPGNQTIATPPVKNAPIGIQNSTVHASNATGGYHINNDGVPYGCLKGGKKPTRRVWEQLQKANQNSTGGGNVTIRRGGIVMQPNKDATQYDDIYAAGAGTEEDKWNRIDEIQKAGREVNQLHDLLDRENQQSVEGAYGGGTTHIKKSTRRTHRVGKSKVKPEVGILLSNKTRRRNVNDKLSQLKKEPIHQIKKKLINNGFIKAGSTAPDTILRAIHEGIEMIGNVKNYNPDIMLYNLLEPCGFQ